MAAAALSQSVIDQWANPLWRLNNLYWITDKEGMRVRFETNWAQTELVQSMHFQNLILKARQLGFTTFIQLFMLDACLFNSNVRAGTIAHNLHDAQTIFRDKIKYPYDNLPEQIKARVTAPKDTSNELRFSNNSSIRVGTSLRSGTLQYLHVSEYGKICAKYPEKAREVRTGALNTVDAGQIIFIESTAEGQEGHFYELCEDAQTKQRSKAHLTKMDFKFHFFAWWRNPEYRLDPDGVVIPEPFTRYFVQLATNHGILLAPEQQAWYVKKAELMKGDMKREYPSTPEEAFEAAIEGAYYADEIAQAELQGRIGTFPPLAGIPVHTNWDIGVGDYTAIWFWQTLRGKIGLVGYYQNSGVGAPHYAKKLAEYAERKRWTYGKHWLPHDVKVLEWGSDRTRIEQLEKAGVTCHVVPDHKIEDGINGVRDIFASCYFDEAECADGLKALRNYRKEWDDKHGIFRDAPRHDAASHGADSFRYVAMSYKQDRPPAPPAPKPKFDYVAKPDGTMQSTLSIRELIERQKKRREGA